MKGISKAVLNKQVLLNHKIPDVHFRETFMNTLYVLIKAILNHYMRVHNYGVVGLTEKNSIFLHLIVATALGVKI